MRLLLLEDDADLSGLVVAALKKAGFEVDPAKTCEEAILRLKTTPYDLMILDRTVPDGDGLEVMESAVSLNKTIPALVLTAMSHPDERIHGLEKGADDYLIKPFSMGELVARVKVLLRRPLGAMGKVLEAGDIALDVQTGDFLVRGKPYHLNRREKMLLEILLRRTGRLVNKEQLEQVLYGTEDAGSRGAVDICVFRLRKALSQAKAGVHIHTMRGLGYVLEGDKK